MYISKTTDFLLTFIQHANSLIITIKMNIHTPKNVKVHSKLYTPSTLNIQMKLILLWVWAERAVLGRAKTALKFKYEIEIG